LDRRVFVLFISLSFDPALPRRELECPLLRALSKR
jgi:hypothetical protein